MLTVKPVDTEGLEKVYRRLYWEVNELQIIATPATLEVAEAKQAVMADITKILGYVPEA